MVTLFSVYSKNAFSTPEARFAEASVMLDLGWIKCCLVTSCIVGDTAGSLGVELSEQTSADKGLGRQGDPGLMVVFLRSFISTSEIFLFAYGLFNRCVPQKDT